MKNNDDNLKIWDRKAVYRVAVASVVLGVAAMTLVVLGWPQKTTNGLEWIFSHPTEVAPIVPTDGFVGARIYGWSGFGIVEIGTSRIVLENSRIDQFRSFVIPLRSYGNGDGQVGPVQLQSIEGGSRLAVDGLQVDVTEADIRVEGFTLAHGLPGHCVVVPEEANSFTRPLDGN